MADAMLLEGLKVGLLPAAGGVASLLAARAVPSRWRAGTLGLGVAVTYGLAHGAVAGFSGLPPRESTHWIPWLGLAAGVAALSRSLSAPQLTHAPEDAAPAAGPIRGRAWLLCLLLSAACTWALLGRLSASLAWSAGSRGLWFAGTGAGLLFLWWPVFGGSVRAAWLPGPLALVTGAAAASAMLAHSARQAELTLALAVLLAVVALAGLLRPRARDPRGALVVGSVLLGALLLYDQHLLELPTLELGLLVAGWASLYLGRLPFSRGLPPRRAMLISTLLAVLPVLAALLIGLARYRAELAANPYY